MNYASVVQRLFGRVPTNLSLVSVVGADTPEAAAIAEARGHLADFSDAPRAVARVGDRFAAVGRTHAVMLGGASTDIARIPEEEQEKDPPASVRELTAVEKKNAREHVKHGRKVYRFGRFKPGMTVTWNGERWIIYDARARGGSRFTLMLVSPDYDKLADEVQPSELGETESADVDQTDDPFAGNAWVQASRDIAKLHAEKPRPLNRMFGANPTPEQKAKHAELMREWSKKDREARKRLKAAKAAANESVDESKSFTPAQLAQLRDQFASVERVDPTGPAYDRMVKLLDGMSQQQLKQVAGAGIKFLSKLALNRVKQAEAVGEARVRRVLWSTKVGNDTWGAAVLGPHFFATLNGEDYDFEDGEVYGLVAPKKVPPAIAARLEKSRQDFEADKQTTRESVQEARFQHGDRVRIHYKNPRTDIEKAFQGKVGSISGEERDGSTRMFRVRFNPPVQVPGVDPVTSDLWTAEFLKPAGAAEATLVRHGTLAAFVAANTPRLAALPGEGSAFQKLWLGEFGALTESTGASRWTLFGQQLSESFQFFDRYDALGIPRPDPATMCKGPCEGTGIVPISRDETDPELRRRWDVAEQESPADDGWHFVVCPTCEGSRLAGDVRFATRAELKAMGEAASFSNKKFDGWSLRMDRGALILTDTNKLVSYDLTKKHGEFMAHRTDATRGSSGYSLSALNLPKALTDFLATLGESIDEEGVWRTTKSGHRIFIDGGEVTKGNPHVVKAAGGSSGETDQAKAHASKHGLKMVAAPKGKAAVGSKLPYASDGTIVAGYAVNTKGQRFALTQGPDGKIGMLTAGKHKESVDEASDLDAEVDRVSRDLEYVRADYRSENDPAKKRKLKARMDKLDASFEALLAKRKAGASEDGDGKWRTTTSGHKIFIDGDGKVTKGNPHVIGKAKESIDEGRGAPGWRTLADELIELSNEIDTETEVSLEVWRGNWNLQLGPGTPTKGRRAAWASATIDPGLTMDDAKEVALDMLDQIKGDRQHDESVVEKTLGANLAGWRVAVSSTGATVRSKDNRTFHVVVGQDGELQATDGAGSEVSVSNLPGYVIRAIEKMLGAEVSEARKSKHEYGVGDRVEVRGEGPGEIVRLRHDSPNAYEVRFDKGGTKVVWDNPEGAAAVGFRKITRAESIDESMPKMAPGQIWALSTGGPAEDPDFWLFVTHVQKNGAPSGVQYDVRRKKAIFSSFNGYNGKFSRQDSDAFREMTGDYDAESALRVTNTLARNGMLKLFPGIAESVDEAQLPKSPHKGKPWDDVVAMGKGHYIVKIWRGQRTKWQYSTTNLQGGGFSTTVETQDVMAVLQQALRMNDKPKRVWVVVGARKPADPFNPFEVATAFWFDTEKNLPESLDEAKVVPPIDSPTYRDVAKLPKYNVKVSPLSAHGSDGGKLLAQRLPGWTKADHLAAAAEHERLAAEMEKQWGVEANSAAKAAWGRDYKASDYRISGIASDEFDAKHKDELRRLAHTSSAHKDAAHAHKAAAKMRSLAKESLGESAYYLIRRDDGKFLDGMEWVDEDPGFGFRDMATARKAASDMVIRGKLRKGKFQIVTRDTDDVDEGSVNEAQVGSTMSLFLKLERTVLKKTEGMPGTAPVYSQLVKMLGHVRDAIKGHETKTGDDAVRAFVPAAATAGFMANFGAPMTQLQKHPLVSHDKFTGKLSIVESVDEMAKLSAKGAKELMRASKESVVTDDEAIDWRRVTRAWMDDGRVLEKRDVNFKPTGDASYQQARKHSYGWKVLGRFKPGLLKDNEKLAAAMTKTRANLEADGWTIESFTMPQ